MAQVVTAPGGSTGRRVFPKPPVLNTTRYDLVSAFMIAIVIAMIVLVVWVTALWLANHRVMADPDPRMSLMPPGGVPEGAPDETLKVESPEDPTTDPSVVDKPDEEQQNENIFENVVELSKTAAQQVQPHTDVAKETVGKKGSSKGSRRRPLGSGPGDVGGSSYDRWFIRFSEGSLTEYAKQLDYFKIELGLLNRKDRRLDLITKVSGTISHRAITDLKEKKDQVNFAWAGGGRKKIDLDLFRKAGVSTAGGNIVHFYPKPTVLKLLWAEKKKARKPILQIERTYFVVRKSGSGYEFFVTKIRYR